MSNTDKLIQKLKLPNGSTISDLSRATGISERSLYRFNETGVPPSSLKTFIIGTKYRVLPNGSQKSLTEEQISNLTDILWGCDTKEQCRIALTEYFTSE